ncbi:MAG: helix-turn-helix transcriptional regulator [Lachnospiraceae bacterium]|nr:helix-turn-helix transcriptional regulator [Lachnospiraceae bacterium]
MSLNPSYFSALFKKETGTNFSAYLLNVKMENARLLLRNSNLSLSDISAELGFESQSYFSKMFKKETGLTPRDYRHHI